jgi:hypothetical protein
MIGKFSKLYSLFLFTQLFWSCTNNTRINNIDTIDLVDAYKLKGEVFLSQVAEKIEYIPLEALPKYFVDRPYTIVANDSNLIIIAFQKLLVFERSTGRFRYEISSYGRGPGEYLFTIYHTAYYEPDDIIFAGKDLSNFIIGFSSDGTLKKTIKHPNNLDAGYSIVSIWPSHENNYLGYSINYKHLNFIKMKRHNKLLNDLQMKYILPYL